MGERLINPHIALMQSLVNGSDGGQRHLHPNITGLNPLVQLESFIAGNTVPGAHRPMIHPVSAFYEAARQTVINNDQILNQQEISRVSDSFLTFHGKSPIILGNLKKQIHRTQVTRMEQGSGRRITEGYEMYNASSNHQDVMSYFPRNVSGGMNGNKSDSSSKSNAGRHRNNSFVGVYDSDSTSNSFSTGGLKHKRNHLSTRGSNSDQSSKKCESGRELERDRDSSDDGDQEDEEDGIVDSKRLTRNQREQRRSLRISEQIEMLGKLLATNGIDVKVNKYNILTKVSDYIKELQKRTQQASARNATRQQPSQSQGEDAAKRELKKARAISHSGVDSNMESAGTGTVEVKSESGYENVSSSSTSSIPRSSSPTTNEDDDGRSFSMRSDGDGDGEGDSRSAAGAVPAVVGDSSTGDSTTSVRLRQTQMSGDLTRCSPISDEDYCAAFRWCAIPWALARVDGRISECNESFSRVSGYTRAELLSFTIFNLIESSQLQETFSAVGSLLTKYHLGVAPPLTEASSSSEEKNSLSNSIQRHAKLHPTKAQGLNYSDRVAAKFSVSSSGSGENDVEDSKQKQNQNHRGGQVDLLVTLVRSHADQRPSYFHVRLVPSAATIATASQAKASQLQSVVPSWKVPSGMTVQTLQSQAGLLQAQVAALGGFGNQNVMSGLSMGMGMGVALPVGYPAFSVPFGYPPAADTEITDRNSNEQEMDSYGDGNNDANNATPKKRVKRPRKEGKKSNTAPVLIPSASMGLMAQSSFDLGAGVGGGGIAWTSDHPFNNLAVFSGITTATAPNADPSASQKSLGYGRQLTLSATPLIAAPSLMRSGSALDFLQMSGLLADSSGRDSTSGSEGEGEGEDGDRDRDREVEVEDAGDVGAKSLNESGKKSDVSQGSYMNFLDEFMASDGGNDAVRAEGAQRPGSRQ